MWFVCVCMCVCVCVCVGRMYDFHILDMVELGIENFKSFFDFKVIPFSSDHVFNPSLSLPP